jgi:hypothetical protein
MANIWSFLTTRLMQNQIIELLVRKHMDVDENERTTNIPFRHTVNVENRSSVNILSIINTENCVRSIR